MRLIEWQLYWRRWHLSCSVYYDEEFGLYELIAALGPLQMRFYQK